MLDIRFVREHLDEVATAMQNRNHTWDSARFQELDESRRASIAKEEELQAKRNAISKSIGKLMGEGKKEEAEATKAKVNEMADELAHLEQLEEEYAAEIKKRMQVIPQIIDPSVPIGKDDTENVELRRWGEPTHFDYEPQAHWDLGADLGILDPETAAKVTGKRFHFYRGLGCRLERSIIAFFMDTHSAHGYTEIFPPFIANKDSMTGTGQLPKFAEDMYKLEGLDYYLIPTAEVPVTNMYRGDIIDGSKLPMSFCAYSACFRGEAGSAGRDTRGLIRQHEFNKVELVKFTKPEESYAELEKLTHDAERVLQLLGLPYRVVVLSTGDLGFSSAKTYDIEVWMPSYGRYVEISSCSDFEDFQARRASIRYKENPKDKAKLVHTLNGSGVAVGRTVAAIMENYQNPDGSITVPEVLRPYMGCDRITKQDTGIL